MNVYGLPRHVKERLATLAKFWKVPVADALGMAVQAAEALLDQRTGLLYTQRLRVRLYTPEKGYREITSSAGLPPLPTLDPALGCGMDLDFTEAVVGRAKKKAPAEEPTEDHDEPVEGEEEHPDDPPPAA